MFDARRRWSGAATALATTLILACSGETASSSSKATRDAGAVEGDGGGGGEPAGPADPALYARAVCEAESKCQPIGFRRSYGSLSACITRFLPRTTAALRAPGNTVTAAQLAACAAKLSATCDDTLDTLPECAFRGSHVNGEPCAFSGQCEGGSCVDVRGTCGTCSTRVPSNRPCSGPAGQGTCEAGSECIAGVCSPLGSEGSACTEPAACKPTLTCIAGTCQPRLGNDAPCMTSAYDCAYAKGLICVPNGAGATEGTCKPQRFAKTNEPCGTDPATGVFTECEAPSVCSSSAELGTCEPPSSGTCTADANCRGDETCVRGTCTYLAPVCK